MEVSLLMNDLPLWSAPFGLSLLEKVDFKQEAKILDIGCGLGFPSIELAMRFGKNCSVYGVDPWKEGIEVARTKARLLQLTNVHFLKQFAENLSFEEAYFDIIVSNNGLNNVQNIEKSMLECGRVCKKGGQMVFTVNSNKTMSEFYDIFYNILVKLDLKESMVLLDEHIYNKRRPANEISKILSKAGFESSLEEKIFFLRFMDAETMFEHYWIRELFYPAWIGVVKEELREKVFDLIKQGLNEIAFTNKGLKLTVPYLIFKCTKI